MLTLSILDAKRTMFCKAEASQATVFRLLFKMSEVIFLGWSMTLASVSI